MSTLAERIKDRMDALGLTNAQFASLAEVRPPTSFNWASGKTKEIKAGPLLKAARALKVTPDWLATGKGQKFPDESSAEPLLREERAVYRINPQPDPIERELLDLFHQLDTQAKREWLAHLRGYIAGARPHTHGGSPALAGKKTGAAP